ncbi:MFS transporter [Gordonia phthalatica]|uniref:MFS transporter n=1 Tax=Gordonia phthalatica TaxID=1136941 RepID=UPI000785576F|nr:MFS transporter [Gordonia phthalatica]
MVRTSRPWLSLGVLSVVMLVIGLDMMVLMVALPELARDLNATTGDLQWITMVYPLALGALMIPLGAVGDRIGRVRLLSWSLLGFAAASVFCALSPTVSWLIAGRMLLGVAAAAITPLSMGVLPSLFPDPDERRRALGIWMAAAAAGVPIGPIFGGLLLQHFWWGSAFLIGVPFAVVAAVSARVLIPEPRESLATGPIDVVSAVVSTAAFGGLVYAFTSAGDAGWLSPRFLIGTVAALGLLTALVRRIRTAAHPLFRPELLASRSFLLGTALVSAAMLLLGGITFQYSQLFAVAFDADSLGVGLRLLPVIGGLIVGTRLVEPVASRLGQRAAGLASGLLIGVGALLQALLTTGGYGVFAAVMVLTGVGMGGLIPLSMDLAVGEVVGADAGSGSAVLQSLRQIGTALGVAIIGSVSSVAYQTGIDGLRLSALPHGVADAVRDNGVAGVAAAQSGAPDLVEPITSAFLRGVSAAGWVGVGIGCGLTLLCLLLPAQSGHGRSESNDDGATDGIAGAQEARDPGRPA